MKRNQRSSRRTILCLESLEDRCLLSAGYTPLDLGGLPGLSAKQSSAVTQAYVSAAYGQLPLSFEANQGQTDAQVNFLSRGSGYTLFLTPDEAVLRLQKHDLPGADTLDSPGSVLRMQLVGAKAAPQVVGLDAWPGRSNDLTGND